MDRDKARLPDGRVFLIHNIKIDERYRHPDYTCTLGDGALSETGRIDLFKLESTKPGDPSFVARWDGGNRSFLHKIRYDVDIDIIGVSARDERRFKKGRGGYGGHHTMRVKQDENKYDVRITVPAGVVFDATVSFNRRHAIEISAPIPSKVTVGMTKAGWLAKLISVIMYLYQLARSSVRLRG
jgi:hypothetical protein